MPSTLTLARLTLNTLSADVARDLRNPTDMHRTLMRLLPDQLSDTPRADASLLWRLEPGPIPRVLTQAAHQLTSENLPPGYLTDYATKDIAPIIGNLTEGASVRFQVTANPTRSTANPTRHTTTDSRTRRGRRVSITRVDDAHDWWTARATQHGLTTVTLTVERQPDLRVHRNNGTATLHAFTFTGIAHIADPTAVADLVRAGIGRGKAWGLGLIALTRA